MIDQCNDNTLEKRKRPASNTLQQAMKKQFQTDVSREISRENREKRPGVRNKLSDKHRKEIMKNYREKCDEVRNKQKIIEKLADQAKKQTSQYLSNFL
mmetsp:Transcript_5881/g.7636  ORF Transcript_5881/g.7636 Transcript_5881/m.7636 type:complete len:98 (-) Transcript_5881:1-294(-)